MEVEQPFQNPFRKSKLCLASSNFLSMASDGGLESSNRLDGSVLTSRGDSGLVGVVAMTDGEVRIRKKHRRGSRRNKPRKKRDWKPYDKLTWDEKRQLDAEDAAKAIKKRQQLAIQKGRPIAPYNTTQFLMEEHDPGNENFQVDQRLGVERQVSMEKFSENDASDKSSSSDEYFEKDFDEAYHSAHVERLHSMAKDELVKTIMDLEKKLERSVESGRENERLLSINFELAIDNIRLKEENAKFNELLHSLKRCLPQKIS